MRTIRKGVEEEIVDGFDWSDRLEPGDLIADSVWNVDSGITGDNATFDMTSTELEVLGGSLNQQYKCQNEITTVDGFVYQKSFKVIVVER